METLFVTDLPFLLCQTRDQILDAGDEDLSLGRDETAHELYQIRHGLVHCTTEDTGMQVARWP